MKTTKSQRVSRAKKDLAEIASAGLEISKNMSNAIYAVGAASTLSLFIPKQGAAKLLVAAEYTRKLCGQLEDLANAIMEFDESRIITEVQKDIKIVTSLPGA